MQIVDRGLRNEKPNKRIERITERVLHDYLTEMENDLRKNGEDDGTQ
jgi:hypothetical protein